MRNVMLPGTFTDQVETIVAAGGTITERFRFLAERWSAYVENDHQIQDELNEAILDPDSTPEHLAHLRILAEAAASSNPQHEATVRNAAAAEVLAALRVEYRSVAEANYNAIREVFNSKARSLIKALETTDAEAPAEAIVKATAKERTAWSDGPALAAELNALLGTLRLTAELAGLQPSTSGADAQLIGLTVNADGLHRRRVWEAWSRTAGRAGRWRELWKLGATVEAPELEDAKPYREPAPMAIRTERTATGWRQHDHDPEDDAHAGKKPREDAVPTNSGVTVL